MQLGAWRSPRQRRTLTAELKNIEVIVDVFEVHDAMGVQTGATSGIMGGGGRMGGRGEPPDIGCAGKLPRRPGRGPGAAL